MNWLMGFIRALILGFFQSNKAIKEARKAGAAQANAEISIQTASKEAAIAQAATDAPQTKDEVVVALRRGEF